MAELLDTIVRWWPILLGFTSLVVWFIRIELRSLENSNKIMREGQARKEDLTNLELRLEKQRAEDQAQRKEDRDNTNSLIREVQGDIKLLLQRVVR